MKHPHTHTHRHTHTIPLEVNLQAKFINSPQTVCVMLVMLLKYRCPEHQAMLFLLFQGCIAPYVQNLCDGSGVRDLLKEEKLLQAAHLLWFEDHISQSDSAPPGSHLHPTILTLNTTSPFLSSHSSLTSLLLPPLPRSVFLPPFYLVALLALIPLVSV